MKHLFVPYELAKLAKEKGFDEQCLTYWMCSHGIPFLSEVNISLEGVIQYKEESMIIAPLYQQLVDWFREKHYVELWVQPFMQRQRTTGKLFLPDETYSYYVFKDGTLFIDGIDFIEPREALTAALFEAFKLI